MTDFTKTFRRTTYPTIAPSSPANNQSGRTILVTGGSEGVGYGIAKGFVEAQAAKVIIISRSQQKLALAEKQIKEDHANAPLETKVCDASDDAEMQKLWSELAERGVFIDVLVLNAATTAEPRSIKETIETFNFNVIANIQALEHFKSLPNPQKRQKFLVHLNSGGLNCYPFPEMVYAATKAAIANYLCHLADHVPETEMRIINLSPGAVFTAAAERAAIVPRDIPIWDDPSLSAHMAVWTTGESAAFLHGRYIWANWDADELIGMKEKILSDAAFLKIGITGVEGFSVEKIFKKTSEQPLP